MVSLVSMLCTMTQALGKTDKDLVSTAVCHVAVDRGVFDADDGERHQSCLSARHNGNFHHSFDIERVREIRVLRLVLIAPTHPFRGGSLALKNLPPS